MPDWEEKDGRIFVTVTSAKPIDERITRYLDRSEHVRGRQGREQVRRRPDADDERRRQAAVFLFGTDNTGRDLLTRTLIAGRVSLAIGLLAGLVAVVIGVLYGAAAGFSAARPTRS